jgi:allantoin racemase
MRSIDTHPDSRNLLEGKEREVLPRLHEVAVELIEEDGADVICLGSTTMHQAHSYLEERLPVPVLNPGPLSYLTADAMLALGLTHSRKAYPVPLVPKPEMISAMLTAAVEAEDTR